MLVVLVVMIRLYKQMHTYAHDRDSCRFYMAQNIATFNKRPLRGLPGKQETIFKGMKEFSFVPLLCHKIVSIVM